MKDIVSQFEKRDQEGKVFRSMLDILFAWVLEQVLAYLCE